MKPIKYQFKEIVPLPKKVVWDILSDTDHLNRFIGLFPVTFSMPDHGSSLFYRWAEAKVFGLIPLKWKEYPFEWEKERFYAVERQYEFGPLKCFYGGVELLELEALNGHPQTEVTLFADFTARNRWSVPVIPVVGKRSMKLTIHYLQQILSNANAEKQGTMATPRTSRSSNLNDLLFNNRLAALKSRPIDTALLSL